MNSDKPAVKCVPMPPKSLAREYSLNTFIKQMDNTVARAASDDPDFNPKVSKDGWCQLRAYIPSNAKAIILCAHDSELVDCGFEITIPEGHEIQVRNVNPSRFLITNGTQCEGNPQRVRMNLINFGMSVISIHHGAVIGEMCVRPTNNLPIIVGDD